MIQLFLTICLLVATLAQPSGGAACTIAADYADVPSALSAAQASAPRCLFLPAGVYSTSLAGGSWLAATADNLEIRGAGIGKTIIQTQGITLTGTLTLFMLRGAHQHVHDLTINVATNYSGTAGTVGIQAYDEASYPTIENVEITGGYSGDGGANGAAISLYKVWNNNNARQFATVQNNYIHDTRTSAIVVNSSANFIRSNRLIGNGLTTLSHALYAQGGYNLYDGNYIANASGYSYHGWKKVPSIDASGDQFVNNVSVDPGLGHAIVSGLPGLTRNTTISGDLFRNTAGRQSNGITADNPVIITSSTFEDVASASGPTINLLGAGSIAADNILTSITPAGNGIAVASASTAENNTISGAGYLAGMSTPASGAVARGNRISVTRTGSSGIVVNANGTRVEDNDVSSTGLSCMKLLNTALVIIRDNILTCPAPTKAIDMPADSVATLDRNILR